MRHHQISRRDFIKKSTIGTAGFGLGVTAMSGCGTKSNRKLDEIGLQVSTIRDELKKDWRATLEEVARIGYNTLELGGHYGPSLEEFKLFLKELGLNPLAGGAAIAGLQESLDEIIESSLEMGKKYLICYWPWTDSPENKTIDDWKSLAESLNKIGDRAKRSGLEFTYHNHDLEFKLTEGKIPYDVILENTDPAVVGMEIDLYWIEKGNQKAIPYFEKYPGRFPLWHIKDMDNTPERSFACVGQGIIDFPEIFKKAHLAGMKHIFVEHDRPESPMDCIRASYEYLKKLRY